MTRSRAGGPSVPGLAAGAAAATMASLRHGGCGAGLFGAPLGQARVILLQPARRAYPFTHRSAQGRTRRRPNRQSRTVLHVHTCSNEDAPVRRIADERPAPAPSAAMRARRRGGTTGRRASSRMALRTPEGRQRVVGADARNSLDLLRDEVADVLVPPRGRTSPEDRNRLRWNRFRAISASAMAVATS